MAFERIYQDEACPIYVGYTLHVLANPTGAEKNDWWYGHLGLRNCPGCQTARSLATQADVQVDTSDVYCPGCSEARDRRGRAAVAIFGQSHMADFDFSTVSAALTTLSRQDVPDDFMAWIYMLPGAVWDTRTEQLKKTLTSPSLTTI